MYHPERGIRLAAHGDDFTALGIDENLDWYRKKIMSRFKAKVKGKDRARKGRHEVHEGSEQDSAMGADGA